MTSTSLAIRKKPKSGLKTGAVLLSVAGALLPLAARSQSQSTPTGTVTLYGRVDTSVNLVHYGATSSSPGAHASYLSSDSSSFGFRGTEDLGAGMRAYFKLESWFNSDTGTQFNPNQFFSRESYVGLGDAAWGSLQLGSQYAPSTLLSLWVDPFLRSNQGGIFTLFQQVPGNLRGFPSIVNNAVQYISPTMGGVSVRAMVSASEGVAAGNSLNTSVDYSKDRLHLAASFDRMRVAGSAAGLPGVPVVDNKTITMGASYRFDVLTVHGYAMQNDLEHQPKVRGYMLGVTVPVGAGQIRASWSRRSLGDANATLLSAGYFHLLSKRTTLYAEISRLGNKGSAHFNLWPSSTDAGSSLPAAGATVQGAQFGIRHFF